MAKIFYLKEKIDPYLRPLYDSLEDMIPSDKLEQFMSNRTIEVAPLAFMRGRTLDNCFVILDEAQNIKNFKSQRWQTLLNFHSHLNVTNNNHKCT